jgi:tight adherence protein B
LGLLAAAIATGVRSGQTVGQAIAAVHATMGHQWCDRLSCELAACENRIRRGDGIGEALGEWARWSKHVEVELLTAAIRLGTETGGRLADALDGVAATITIRNELQAEQKALSSQARMTARVLVVAPAVFALLAGVIDPRVSRLLIATPLGWAVIALAGLLDLAGWRWMTRIVTRLEAE